MFRKKCLITLFCFIQGAYFGDIGSKNSDNYGPYDINIKSYEVIKGPKQKTISIFNSSLIKQNGDYISHSNLTLLEHAHLEEIRYTVYSVENTRKSILWNYKIPKPCTHFLMGTLLESYLKANKNCVIKKDVYIVDLNLSETIKKFLGTSFFYGEFTFKINFFTKNANILSLIVTESLTKKKLGN